MIQHGVFADPDAEFDYLWSPSSFEQTSFGDTEGDRRLIGILHIDDTHDREDLIEKMMSKFASYTFSKITAEEALALCIKWYGDYFEMDSDGFAIIDDRPDDTVL